MFFWFVCGEEGDLNCLLFWRLEAPPTYNFFTSQCVPAFSISWSMMWDVAVCSPQVDVTVPSLPGVQLSLWVPNRNDQIRDSSWPNLGREFVPALSGPGLEGQVNEGHSCGRNEWSCVRERRAIWDKTSTPRDVSTGVDVCCHLLRRDYLPHSADSKLGVSVVPIPRWLAFSEMGVINQWHKRNKCWNQNMQIKRRNNLHIWVQLTFDNSGLRGTGSLTCRYFSLVNTTVLHGPW